MLKLKKKSIIPYKGKVYDLKVSTPDMSYNIDNIVVHNSAGGCLILFILDITKIDPIKYNLIFERFLNPARQDPPDVDLDISSNCQKEVEGYLKSKYGEDKVCHISNFIKFGSKTIIKDLCRVFELDYVLSNKLTELFSPISQLPLDEELTNALEVIKKTNDQKLMDFYNEHITKFIGYGMKLQGMIRQFGRHASGILVSNKPLNDSILPLYRTKGEIVTGVQEGADERAVTELGYLKLDILGLATAEIINQAFKLIESHYGEKNLEQKLLKSDFDDPKVYEAFQQGNCRDIFQFGSDQMVALIKNVQPVNIDDICAINALFRPAIISAGGIDEYLHGRENPAMAQEKFDKIHPDIWPILKNTFGVIAYQEQLMFIMQQIGGFTMAEADKGRKIYKLLHKGNASKSGEFMELIQKFGRKAGEKGVSKTNITYLNNLLAKYSEYSFNRSHSFAYALNAYISMWLKINYPKEYYISLFNNSGASDISSFIRQAKNEKIIFNELLCNQADKDFSIDYDTGNIKMSLNLIKGIASKDVGKLIDTKLDGLNELMNFVKKEKIGKRSIEPLCRLNYFREIFPNSKGLENLLLTYRNLKEKQKDKVPEMIEEARTVEDYTQAEKFLFERNYLGFYLSDHPFDAIMNKIIGVQPDIYNYVVTPSIVSKGLEEGKYLVCGIINDIVTKKTKASKKEYFKLVLEDNVTSINLTIWNIEDIIRIKKGDFVFIEVSKSDFGITKSKNTAIKLFEE